MEGMLRKIVVVAIFLLSMAASACAAGSPCQVALLSGEANGGTISLTFRNLARVPIRRLDFSCRLTRAQSSKIQPPQCVEPNASFLPQSVYTVHYAYSRGTRGPVVVSVRRVLFSDGHTWQPTRALGCRVLTVQLPGSKPNGKNGTKGERADAPGGSARPEFAVKS